MRIIYLCTAPTANQHAGGVKVIYDHAILLNDIGYKSAVIHEKANYKYKWADKTPPILNEKKIYKTDHVIIPEVLVKKYSETLLENDIQYSIFVQNGYYINEEQAQNEKKSIDRIYHKATNILSISEDTTQIIQAIYINSADKIKRIYCSVDASKFKSAEVKENIITYMPRKLNDHARSVIFLLSRLLPSGWTIEAIDGQNEKSVALSMGKSKIFMSFSSLEGLGLPPIEAALSGNYVIGYHGGGGKEYFRNPNFDAVECGDVRLFAQKVANKARNLSINSNSHELLPGILHLRETYSRANETAALLQFVKSLNNNEFAVVNREKCSKKIQLRKNSKLMKIIRQWKSQV